MSGITLFANLHNAPSLIALIVVSHCTLFSACKNKSQDIDVVSKAPMDGATIKVSTEDKLTPSTVDINNYLFVPPFEDTKIMGRHIKWIHRFPVTNSIDGFTDIVGSLYFLAAGNSVIEKIGDKWVLKTRLKDRELMDIWGSNNNNIYVVGWSNLFHFDGKQWKTVEEWKKNNFGYEKRAKGILGCPNGDFLIVSAIVLPATPYHHPREIKLYDFYKNGSWQTIPSYDEYPDGAIYVSIIGLDCSLKETKILMNYDGDDTVPNWLQRPDIILFKFKGQDELENAWSDSKGFIVGIFYSRNNDSPLRFYENNTWTEKTRLGDSIANSGFLLWGRNKNDIYASGNVSTFHFDGSKWLKDKVQHLPNMDMNYIAGMRSEKFTFMGSNDKEGILGITYGYPPVIFRRNDDGNWWPEYQKYGPYVEEWSWKWMWRSGDEKFMIANESSAREFDIGEIPNGKMKLRKVIDFKNERILDAYSADYNRTYLLILDDEQETDDFGYLTEGQKTVKKVYMFDGEKIVKITDIDDKNNKYIKIFAFNQDDKGFLLYGSDAIALYDGKKWTEKKVCGKKPFLYWNVTVPYPLSVWGKSLDDFYVAGDSGCLMRKKQEKWIKVGSGTSKHLTAITGNEEGELFIARSDGTLFKYKDNKAEKIEVPIEKGSYIIKIIIKDDVYYLLYNDFKLGVCEGGQCEKVQLFMEPTRTAYYVEGFGLLILEEKTGSIIGILDKPEQTKSTQ